MARFLIICDCGHRFFRAHPCNPNNLATWSCPKSQRNTLKGHYTRCSTAEEQIVHNLKALTS